MPYDREFRPYRPMPQPARWGSAPRDYDAELRRRGAYDADFARGPRYDDDYDDDYGRDTFEFGGGYIGGRGYGGTNYDYTHGYSRTPIRGYGDLQAERGEPRRELADEHSEATRGGYEWGAEAALERTFGPARYGYGPYHERLQRQRRTDEDIREDVEDTLFYDTWVDADNIEVEVEDGIVTLRGELPDYQEIRYATDDAWDVEGVRGVQTELRVKRSGGAPRADQRSDAREEASESRGAAPAASSSKTRATDPKKASNARAASGRKRS